MLGIYNPISSLNIAILLPPNCRDDTIDRNDRIGVENRLLQITAQHETDVADDQLPPGIFYASDGHFWTPDSLRCYLDLFRPYFSGEPADEPAGRRSNRKHPMVLAFRQHLTQ